MFGKEMVSITSLGDTASSYSGCRPQRHQVRNLVSIPTFSGLNTSTCRPANILLSDQNIPVIVDFGFAEQYELDSVRAFHSNLSYGTPEVFGLLHICGRVELI